MIWLSIFAFLLGTSLAQLDSVNLTFTQLNDSYITTPRFCGFPPNATINLKDCDYLAYVNQLVIQAIPAIVVTGVFAVILFLFLISSCCSPFCGCKLFKKCYKLNVPLKMVIMLIPTLFFVAGIALTFAEYFLSQGPYITTNNYLLYLNNTFNNVSAELLIYVQDPTLNQYYDLSSTASDIQTGINNWNSYYKTISDVVYYVWIAHSSIVWFTAGMAAIAGIFALLAVLFASKILYIVFALFGVLMLIGAVLNIAIAVIMDFILRDLCTEVYYQHGVWYQIQQIFVDPINTAITQVNQGIVNLTDTGCQASTQVVIQDPFCCSNLTLLPCNTTTLPDFRYIYITDDSTPFPGNDGSGLTYIVNACATLCTGQITQPASEVISDTGYSITILNGVISACNVILAAIGNQFLNVVYELACVQTTYIIIIFALSGIFIVGTYLMGLFMLILFNRAKKDDDDDL